MLSRTRSLVPLAVAALSACGQFPTERASRSAAPTFLADRSACTVVNFTVHLTPTAEPFHLVGQVNGDLEGTVSFAFDPGSIAFHGATVHNSGTAHWTITGGTVSGLGSFDTAFDNLNHLTDRPGSPATLFENTGTHRAISGVSMANLTYKGTFDGGSTLSGTHEYHGVICP